MDGWRDRRQGRGSGGAGGLPRPSETARSRAPAGRVSADRSCFRGPGGPAVPTGENRQQRQRFACGRGRDRARDRCWSRGPGPRSRGRGLATAAAGPGRCAAGTGEASAQGRAGPALGVPRRGRPAVVHRLPLRASGRRQGSAAARLGPPARSQRQGAHRLALEGAAGPAPAVRAGSPGGPPGGAGADLRRREGRRRCRRAVPRVRRDHQPERLELGRQGRLAPARRPILRALAGCGRARHRLRRSRRTARRCRRRALRAVARPARAAAHAGHRC